MLKIFKNSWNKRILTLAVPIVLGNLTQPVLAFVNTFISGRLPGPYALGGVALANVFFNFVFWGFGFLRMGSSGLVAQAYGAEDWEKIRLIVWRYLSIALFIGLCVLLLGHPLVFGAMNLLGATGRVRECAFVFCNIGIFSAPAVLMNYVITGALFGSQRVKIALVIQAVIYMSNAYLSLLLAYWLGMGVAGIALANLSADYLGLVLGFWALIYYRPRILAHVEFSALFHVPELIKLLLINRDLFVRTICLLFAFGWLARNGARQGDLILAGNTLLLNFQSFGAYAMDAFSNAAEALVGEAIGAKKRQDFLNCVKVSIVWSFIVAGVFSVIYLVFGREIVALLTNQESIRACADRYLGWIIALPICSALGYQLDGIFIGGTRTIDLRNCMIVSVAVFVAVSMLFLHLWGNHGLWAAFMLLMLMRGFTLTSRWKKFVAETEFDD